MRAARRRPRPGSRQVLATMTLELNPRRPPRKPPHGLPHELPGTLEVTPRVCLLRREDGEGPRHVERLLRDLAGQPRAPIVFLDGLRPDPAQLVAAGEQSGEILL